MRIFLVLGFFCLVTGAPSALRAAPGEGQVTESAPVELRLHHSLSASAGRLGVGVNFDDKELRVWSCEKACRRAQAQMTLQIPVEALALKRSVLTLKLRAQSRVLWIRYGNEDRNYSLLFAGSSLKEASEGEGRQAPLLILKGWGGERSKSKTSLELQPSPKGMRLFLLGSPEEGLCGRKFPSSSRLYDEQKARFRPVHISPLGKKEKSEGIEIKARAVNSTPGELLLRVTAASTLSASLPVDGDLQKPWSAGYEFVELQPFEGVGFRSWAFSLGAKLETRAHLWLATEAGLYRVNIPPSSSRLYLVDLPEGVEPQCVAVVQPRRAVSLSEIRTRVLVETVPSLRDLVQMLSSSDPGYAMPALSARGSHGALALARSYPRLSRLARARTIEIAEEMPTKYAVIVHVAILEYGAETEREAAMLALVESRKLAAEAIVRRISKASPAGELQLARALVELSPRHAARVLSPLLGEGSSAQRLAMRRNIARLSESKQGAEALRRLVEEQEAGRGTRLKRSAQIDLVRALRPHLKSWAPSSTSLVTKLANGANFEEAYRLAPLALLLAKASPALEQRFIAWLSGTQPQGSSKAQKAALSVRILHLLAEQDPDEKRFVFADKVRAKMIAENVRVRRSALAVLAKRPDPAAGSSIEEAMEDDPWPQVRAAAAVAAGAYSLETEVGQELMETLVSRVSRDSEVAVRRAMARALGRMGGDKALKALRKSLKKDDAYEVRAEAALSLGKLCDQESLEELTSLAQELALGPVGDGPILLGLSALTALARLNPPDLEQRVAPLLREGVSGVLRNQVRQRLEAVQSGTGASCSRTRS